MPHAESTTTMLFPDFLNTLPADEYLSVHRVRFIQTMEWIDTLLYEDGPVLELGAPSPVSNYLRQHRGLTIDNTNHDLRYPFDYCQNNSYGLIINMEVIEHLKDRDEDNRDYWGRTMRTASGLKSCFSECFRVLKPGGAMFVTTPNPNSTLALDRLLAYQPAMVYAPHVHELSLTELRERLGEAGFVVGRLETLRSWTPPADVARAKQWLTSIGADQRDRDDNTFCIAWKTRG